MVTYRSLADEHADYVVALDDKDKELEEQAASSSTGSGWGIADNSLTLFRSSASEDASSTGRPYSPSAASSIDTRLAPSLFSLEIDSSIVLGEQRPTTRLNQSSIRAYYSDIRNAILNGPNKTGSDPWCLPGRLVAGTRDGNAWEIVATLDSRYMYNLVSARAVEKQFLAIERRGRTHFENTVTGQPMYGLGYIDMRLYCMVRIKSRLGREPTIQQRYYDMRFVVVESDTFDMIIGHRTMEKENFYRDKDIIV